MDGATTVLVAEVLVNFFFSLTFSCIYANVPAQQYALKHLSLGVLSLLHMHSKY